jgi:hypothetical protein
LLHLSWHGSWVHCLWSHPGTWWHVPCSWLSSSPFGLFFFLLLFLLFLGVCYCRLLFEIFLVLIYSSPFSEPSKHCG